MKYKRGIYFLFFLVGFGLGLIGFTGPLHEFFHWAFSWLAGSPARITAWGYTAVKHPTTAAALAGPFGEAVVFYIVVFWTLDRRRILACLFVFGLAHSGFILGLYSADFLDWLNPLELVLATVAWVVVNAVLMVLAWIHINKYFQEYKKK